jgi:hypothetical protein
VERVPCLEELREDQGLDTLRSKCSVRNELGDKNLHHLIHELVGNWRREDLWSRSNLIQFSISIMLESLWRVGTLEPQQGRRRSHR